MTSSSNGSRAINITFNLSDIEIGMLTFVNIVFSIVGTIGNVFVCFSFISCPQVRNLLTLFILSLAWSDLLVCLVAQPLYVASLLKGFKQQYTDNIFEDTRKTLTWISLLASAGNLLGVTLHRYVSITRPLLHRNGIGLRTCTSFFLLIIWTVAIGLGASTLYNNTAKMIGQLYVFVAVICLILPIYCRVLCIAKRQQRHIMATMSIQETDSASSVVQGNGTTITTSKMKSGGRRDSQSIKPDRTALRTVGIISAGFALGWFPLLTFPLVYRAFPEHRVLLFNLFQWVNTLALCSSAFNPIVYSWTDRRFRQSLKMIYKRWAVKRLILLEMTQV